MSASPDDPTPDGPSTDGPSTAALPAAGASPFAPLTPDADRGGDRQARAAGGPVSRPDWEWFRSTGDPRPGVIATAAGTRPVQYSAINGMAIVEGDICIGTVADQEARARDLTFEMPDRAPGEPGARGVVITGARFRWPNAVMPYEIDPAMPNQQRVLDAVAHWESRTHIRLPRRTAANAAQFPNYVRFFKGDGCWSHVGMQGGRQDISIDDGCSTGSTIHEIGHALGLWHEQSREDRNTFVRINWANIEAGREHNFNQHVVDGDDTGGYDFGSIMHYPRTAFSRNGQPTIEPLGGQTVGQRTGLSPGDIAAINAIYPRLVSPRLAPRTPISVAVRSADKLDVFCTAADGRIMSAAWQPEFTDWWHGWWHIRGGRAAAGAPVHATVRSADHLDIFVIGTDNRVYTAAWERAFTDGWRGWWQVNGGMAAPGAHVTAVSRSANKLDIFVVGTDGGVYTAAWQPDGANWRGWWRVGGLRAPQGAPVHAVVRGPDKLDIFATDVNGVVQTAAWDAAVPGAWRGWWPILGGRAAPGAAVTAVTRSANKLDVFVVGLDGRVYTAAWEPAFGSTWRGWWAIGGLRAPQGAPVHACVRAPDKLDVFATDAAGAIQTAAWEAGVPGGWRGWWPINGGRAAPGAPVTAASRSRDKLDVFVTGLDGRAWTAAWTPTSGGWRGWWPMGA
jgi:hypothetical protein